MININLLTKQRLTENELVVAGARGGIVKDFGKVMYTLLYLKKIRNSAQCYVPVWVGGGFEGEWICVYTWLSPFTVQLKLSQYC